MAKWIRCQFHGTEQQHLEAGIINNPINLDLMVSFYKKERGCAIIFQTASNNFLPWAFINEATRDLEYNRISALI